MKILGISKLFAILYGVALAGVALWAWIDYFRNIGSTTEHLLPSMALALLTLPTSQLVGYVAPLFPWMEDRPLSLLILVNALGLVQAVIVWLFAKWLASD